MNRGIWTTKDGRDIPIEEMTDAHLLNTIRFVRRRAEEGVKVVTWWDEDCLDVDVEYGGRALQLMQYKALKAEAKRRGIYEKEDSAS